MTVAVVAVGWHFPTDAFAGLALGVGTVLLADGLARRSATRSRCPGRAPRAPPTGLNPTGGRLRYRSTAAGTPGADDDDGAAGSSGSSRTTKGAVVVLGLAGRLDHDRRLLPRAVERLLEPERDAGEHRTGGRPLAPPVEAQRVVRVVGSGPRPATASAPSGAVRRRGPGRRRRGAPSSTLTHGLAVVRHGSTVPTRRPTRRKPVP